VLPKKELDDITANYNMAKAPWKAKQIENEVNAQNFNIEIYRPFNGVVTNKFIKVGDRQNPGMPYWKWKVLGIFNIGPWFPNPPILQKITRPNSKFLVRDQRP